jgi:hypothetical protein
VNMLYSTMQTLGDELGLAGVDYSRCGINPAHFAGMEADPVPLKETDSCAKKFIEKHRRTCYELDGFHPIDLQNLVEKHIRRFTDIEKVICNYQTQGEERVFINNLKSQLTDFVEELLEGQLRE